MRHSESTSTRPRTGALRLLGRLAIGLGIAASLSAKQRPDRGAESIPALTGEERGGAQAEKVITLRADYWYPFNGDPAASSPGYLIELATTIFKNAGYRVDYQTMPWSRAIEMTRAGKFDAIVGAFKTDAPDFIFPAVELGQAETIFLVRKGTPWRYTGIDSLAHVKIGVAKNYGYGQRMDDYVRTHADERDRIETIYGENVIARNLRKLARGRIDATVDAREVLRCMVAREGLTGQFSEAGTISTDKVYIAFSPRHARSETYARILAEGTAELRASGALERLLARYGCTDWTRDAGDAAHTGKGVRGSKKGGQ